MANVVKSDIESNQPLVETYDNTNDTNTIQGYIKHFEDETKLFAKEFLRDDHNDELVQEIISILDDFSLSMFLRKFSILNFTVQKIIVDAVYNKYDKPTEWDAFSIDTQIVYGLIKIWASKQMMRALRKLYIFYKIDEYEINHREMDIKCKELLSKHAAPSILLSENYERIVYEKQDGKDLMLGPEVKVLEMAIESKAFHFLSSKFCQAEVRMRWDPVFRMSSSYSTLFDIICVTATMILPYFRLLSKSNRKAFFNAENCTSDSPTSVLRSILKIVFVVPLTQWTSPSAKFILHWYFRLFYFLCITYQLMKGDPYPLNQYMSGTVSVFNIHCILVMDTVCKITVCLLCIGSDSKMALLKLAVRSSCDWETVLLLVTGLFASLQIYIRPETFPGMIIQISFSLLFYVCFVYATLYLQFILFLDPFYSSILLTIRKMFVFTVRFFLLFVFFWIAYGVCVVNIQDSYYKNETRTNVIWRVFKSGSFEIFGEAEDKYAASLNCGEFPFDIRNLTSPALRCFVDSWFLPLSLFLYMFVTAVVLVNLLTAFLTQIHEEDKQKRIFYKHYMKCFYLIRHEKAIWFPPFSYIPFFLVVCIRRGDTSPWKTNENYKPNDPPDILHA